MLRDSYHPCLLLFEGAAGSSKNKFACKKTLYSLKEQFSAHFKQKYHFCSTSSHIIFFPNASWICIFPSSPTTFHRTNFLGCSKWQIQVLHIWLVICTRKWKQQTWTLTCMYINMCMYMIMILNMRMNTAKRQEKSNLTFTLNLRWLRVTFSVCHRTPSHDLRIPDSASQVIFWPTVQWGSDATTRTMARVPSPEHEWEDGGWFREQ